MRDKHSVRRILKWKRIGHAVPPLGPVLCCHHWFLNNTDVTVEIIEASPAHRALMLISPSAQPFSEYGNYLFIVGSNYMSQKHHI